MRKPGRKSHANAEASKATKPPKVFSKGDIVLAKIRGYPAWPARVEGVTENSKNPALTKYLVFFYGTHQTSKCKSDDLTMYEDVKEAFKKSSKRKALQDALREADENPDVPYIPKESEAAATQEDQDNPEDEPMEEDEKELPQKKGKTPKSSTKRRLTKQPEPDEEEESSSEEIPVPKKRKVSNAGSQKQRVGNETPTSTAKKASKKQVDEDDSMEDVEDTLDIKEDEDLPEKVVEEKKIEKQPVLVDFDNDLFVEYRELEDENMPEDERIVRRLIRSSVWESEDDHESLKIILRGMRLHFSDEKIKNWDQSELLEMVEAERIRAKEKIAECEVLELDVENLDVDQLISELNAKDAKKALADDSDEEDEQDDEKADGTFVKYYTRHQVDLMRQLQDLKYSPAFFKYVVHLASKNPDNKYNSDSQPLPLEEQRQLYLAEEKFILLTEELVFKLPQASQPDLKGAITLLKLLNELDITNIMLFKNMSCVKTIMNICRISPSYGEDRVPDEEKESVKKDVEEVRELALRLVWKFKEIVLPDEWEETTAPSPKKHVNGDDSEAQDGDDYSRSSWMFYNILKAKNRILVKASEGYEDEFSKILQDPIEIHMTKTEFSHLKTLVLYNNKTTKKTDQKAALRICALARSLHPWSDVSTELFPQILLRVKKVATKTNGEAEPKETEVKEDGEVKSLEENAVKVDKKEVIKDDCKTA